MWFCWFVSEIVSQQDQIWLKASRQLELLESILSTQIALFQYNFDDFISIFSGFQWFLGLGLQMGWHAVKTAWYIQSGLFCTFGQRKQTFHFYNVHLPHPFDSALWLHMLRFRHFSLSWCQIKPHDPNYTSLTHAQTKAGSENEVRQAVVAFLSCLLLSSPLPLSPHLLFPLLFPSQLFLYTGRAN